MKPALSKICKMFIPGTKVVTNLISRHSKISEKESSWGFVTQSYIMINPFHTKAECIYVHCCLLERISCNMSFEELEQLKAQCKSKNMG